MKTVAITGGKGGVGKSTIAILLAKKYLDQGKRVVLADLDVECPNDYLLLGQQKLENKIKSIKADFPVLDKDKCNKCGQCVKTCQENAIFQPSPDKYPIFFHNLCSACGACQLACPQGAIKSQKKEIGRVYLKEIEDNFKLLTGEAKACLEETSPVVTETKKKAKRIAKEEKADYLIIDTAAGLHCPVIAALLKVDKAYIVTEPTPLGAHDLKLMLSLVSKLEIKSEVIINQLDMGDSEQINKICKEGSVKIVAKIPYQKEIVDLYSKGKILDSKMNIL